MTSIGIALLCIGTLSLSSGALLPPTGMFGSPCALSHRAPDDPLVFPGKPGASHMHDFYGSSKTDAFTTNANDLVGATSCDVSSDVSGYWIPTLYTLRAGVDPATLPSATNSTPHQSFLDRNYDAVRPDDFVVYYRQSAEDPRDVQPFPTGLKMIAGWQAEEGTAPESFYGVARFGCEGTRTVSTDDFPECRDDSRLVATVDFPDCWDGTRLESFPYHNKHVSYSVAPQNSNAPASCPSSHPIPIPAVTFRVIYDTAGGRYPTVRLSSYGGQSYTFHGDLFSNWATTDLTNRMSKCIRGREVCDVVLNDADVC